MDHLIRLSRTETTFGRQADLPFPQPDPADVIAGPRIRLRYGSAPTEIWVSERTWRRTDRGGEFSYQGRWRSILDPTDEDCLVGKRATLVKCMNKGVTGVVSWDPEDEGFLAITDEVTHRLFVWLEPKHIKLLPDDIHLNPFERAIAAHRGATNAAD